MEVKPQLDVTANKLEPVNVKSLDFGYAPDDLYGLHMCKLQIVASLSARRQGQETEASKLNIVPPLPFLK